MQYAALFVVAVIALEFLRTRRAAAVKIEPQKMRRRDER